MDKKIYKLLFHISRIEETSNPDRGWELQFKILDEDKKIDAVLRKQNFKFQIGDEIWSLSSNRSDMQRRFSDHNFEWYIKGWEFEPRKQRKYLNTYSNTLHYSHEFISAIKHKHPLIDGEVCQGHFDIDKNMMLIENEQT